MYRSVKPVVWHEVWCEKDIQGVQRKHETNWGLLTDILERTKETSIQTIMWKNYCDAYWYFIKSFKRGLSPQTEIKEIVKSHSSWLWYRRVSQVMIRDSKKDLSLVILNK